MRRVCWHLPGEFLTPLLLLVVNVNRRESEDIFQFCQPWDELIDLLLDVFVFLGDGELLAQQSEQPYFVMFNDCIDTTQGGLERGKRIRRLLCDVQKYPDTAHGPLHLGYYRQNPRSQGTIKCAHPSLKLLGRGLAWIPYGSRAIPRMEGKWLSRLSRRWVLGATKPGRGVSESPL